MDPGVIFIPVAVIVFIAIIVFGAMAAARRRKELAAWAASRGLSFDPGKDHGFDDRYGAFACLRQGANRYAHNIMTGRWGERYVTAFDYHYETYSHDKNGRKTHHHHFSAVVLDAGLPLKPMSIRTESFFDKITEFFGYDDIDFESAEFSRKFHVKSPDKRWAYDVLHARTMQFLLDRPRFTIQFDTLHAIAYRSSTFRPGDFEAAADTLAGILDGFPDYLVRQQRESA